MVGWPGVGKVEKALVIFRQIQPIVQHKRRYLHPLRIQATEFCDEVLPGSGWLAGMHGTDYQAKMHETTDCDNHVSSFGHSNIPETFVTRASGIL